MAEDITQDSFQKTEEFSKWIVHVEKVVKFVMKIHFNVLLVLQDMKCKVVPVCRVELMEISVEISVHVEKVVRFVMIPQMLLLVLLVLMDMKCKALFALRLVLEITVHVEKVVMFVMIPQMLLCVLLVLHHMNW